MTARAVVSAASDGLDNPDLDAAFRQNRLRSLERAAPDGIVEIGAGASRQATPASTIARAQSMHGKKVVVRWAPAVATPRRAASKIAWRSACSIQDKSSVALMALLDVAHASRERVAGCDLRSVAGDKDSADPANPVRAQRRRAQSHPHLAPARGVDSPRRPREFRCRGVTSAFETARLDASSAARLPPLVRRCAAT